MAANTIRRGGARRGSAQKRKPRRPKVSLIDRILAALPVSEATLRRIVTALITLFVIAALIAIGSWFGAFAAAGRTVAEAAGDAGFRVEEIEITGLKRMDRMSVYAVALDQKSRAMPLVDLDEVRDRLMRYGWIKDAQVSRRLPDTLLIHIIERQPAAIWQENGRLTLVDAGGVSLEPVQPDAMPDLPLMIGPGANLQMPEYEQLLDAAPALKPLVKAASWVGGRRWDLLFATGETLKLPEGDDPAAHALVKFAKLDGASPLLGKGWLSFDMRDPTRLVARKPGAESRQSMTNTTTPDTNSSTPNQNHANQAPGANGDKV